MRVRGGHAESQNEQVERAIASAHRHFSTGRLAEAEGLTRKVLRASPEHPEALHLLGVIACAVGRAAAGLPLLERAAAARPDDARILFSRANALKALDRLDEAVAAYEAALALKADFAEAAFNLGLALESRLDSEAACQAYRRAVAANPKLFQGYVNLGNLLQRLYRYEAAVAAYEQAITLRPDLAEAHSNLGNALVALGRHEAALEALEKAVALDPRFADGHRNLGSALAQLDRHDEAAAAFRRALEIDPGLADAQADLGRSLRAQGRLEEAAAALRRAVALKPGHGQAAINLGAVLLDQEKPDEALALCQETLARDPGDCRMLALKAAVLLDLGDRAGFDRLLDFDRLLAPTAFTAAPGFASLEDFNGALARHVTSHPTLTYEPPANTTKGGWHTGALLSGDKGPVVALEQMIAEAVTAYLAGHPADPGHPFLAEPPAKWRLSVWAVVLEAAGYQMPHLHPSAWLSGVYYAQLPETIGREASGKAGWIEFGRPSPGLSAKAEPVVREVEPAPGLMVLFPSYFYHRTLPFTAAGQRVSIAFDVLPEPS